MSASKNNKSQQSLQQQQPRVIVIGAGVSGLACARELQQRNYSVLVVEARNRTGGRLKAESLCNASGTTTPIDVGGALIHGISNNPVYQVCEQMGISTCSVNDTVLLEQDGTLVDAAVDEDVSNVFNRCLDETFRKIEASHRQDDDDTMKESFGALFETTVPSSQKDSLLFRWHQANLELSCGASFSNLGVDWNEDEPYEYTGAHVALQQSWNAFTEALAEPLDILYEAPISSIKVVHPQEQKQKRSTSRQRTTTTTTTPLASPSPSRRSRRLQGEEANVRRSSRSNKGIASPTLSISDSTSLSYDATVRHPARRKSNSSTTPQVQVTLHNGQVLQADAVVCTLPLGILKEPSGKPGHVEFDPPFSPEKQQAIQQLGCGLLNKCVLSFPHVFWQDVDFLGIINETPHLILNASVVTGQAILVFMFGGDYAAQVQDLTDVQIMETCMTILRKTCGKNNITTIPEPLDYVVTRWGQDVYARGAFVYIPPGVEGTKQLEAMSEPIVDSDTGRALVLFAGEHTTPYHPSTIHGALSSGIREAYRLDLNFFPAWNQNMEFEPDHLYKKTFTVKRKFQTTASENHAHQQQQQQPPPRKRRHGVMTLRKRPPASYAPNNGSLRSLTPALPLKKSPEPSRRSSRIAGESAPSSDKTVELGRGNQEDRTLVRSYESFRDWQVIDEKVFPVYGADPNKKKSTAQLRARFQQLKAKKRRLDSRILSTWVVPKEQQASG